MLVTWFLKAGVGVLQYVVVNNFSYRKSVISFEGSYLPGTR